ncbi:MAG: hypothetical protein IJF76_00120 [Clostridia bacterium]|nr:hypothetical protein [Clostridia bacterium]
MKSYIKPELNVLSVLSSESIAADPWGSFADDLSQLGGSITSYEYGSGVQI